MIQKQFGNDTYNSTTARQISLQEQIENNLHKEKLAETGSAVFASIFLFEVLTEMIGFDKIRVRHKSI